MNLRGKEVEPCEADPTAVSTPLIGLACCSCPEIDAVLAEVPWVLKPRGVLTIALCRKRGAFHLVRRLARGIFTGRKFRLGYSGLVATVEEGADAIERRVYVRLYSKSAARD